MEKTGNIHFIPLGGGGGGGGTILAPRGRGGGGQSQPTLWPTESTHLCLLLFSFLSTDCDEVINLNSYPAASCTSAVIHSIHRVCILANFRVCC